MNIFLIAILLHKEFDRKVMTFFHFIASITLFIIDIFGLNWLGSIHFYLFKPS
jgi:hypothetical protein